MTPDAASHQDLSLHGQRILVTGVSRSRGIGTAIVERCLGAGAQVAIHGYPNYDLERQYADATDNSTTAFARDMAAKGSPITALTASDLSIATEPARIVKEATEQMGPVTGLVLNHAYSVHAPYTEWTAEHIDAHFAVNVRASMLLIQAFAAQVSEQGGVVTLFTSGQYLGPMIGEIAYATSKEAIRGLCGQVAVALAPLGIRVNCINPGPTDTGYLEGDAYAAVANMFPAKRWGSADDAARLVQFLHSEHARWITGQTIGSEGGFLR